uniref:BTB domain-containing protein n=1 Tax=Ascaris lumbricoides TaxID=6252 RepID=A0A9J2Q7C3_ASCLU
MMTRGFDFSCGDPTEITFIYDWSVQIFQQLNGFNVFGDTETFCTNFRGGSHEWMAHLYRTNFGSQSSPKIHLYLEHTRVMATHISPKKCKFSFKLANGNDNFNDQSSSSIIAMRSSTTFSTMDSFRIPRDSLFANSLTKCFTDSLNVGKTIVITIDLLFDVEAFTPNLSNWFCTVPHPPADTENDFRFKVLRKEVADFTLHCRDGDVRISKSALFLSSDYFRFLFTANDEGLSSLEHTIESYSKSTVEQCSNLEKDRDHSGGGAFRNEKMFPLKLNHISITGSRLLTRDFTLHCRDGDVRISKSALFLSSDYFRFLFTANDEGLSSLEHTIESYSKSTVEQVLVFITTGTFRVPPALTPNFAQELLDVVALFKPLNREAFRNTIHKALCENAAKDFRDLNTIVELLAFAHEANLSQLKQMCISIIVGEHYQRFKQYYNEEVIRSLFISFNSSPL